MGLFDFLGGKKGDPYKDAINTSISNNVNAVQSLAGVKPGATDYLQNGQNNALNTLGWARNNIGKDFTQTGPFGTVSSGIDPSTGKAITNSNANPFLSLGFNRSIQNISDFDNFVKPKIGQATEAYLKPLQRQVAEQIGNYYAATKPGAGANSQLNDAFARFGEETSFNAAQRMQDIENKIRSQALQENQQLFNQTYAPLSQVQSAQDKGLQYAVGAGDKLADLDSLKANMQYAGGKDLSNLEFDFGRSLADIFGNKAQQESNLYRAQSDAKQQQKNANLQGWGNLAGQFLRFGSSLATGGAGG